MLAEGTQTPLKAEIVVLYIFILNIVLILLIHTVIC